MKNVKAQALPETITFRLGLLGAFMTDRFTTRVAALALKPKHVGMLNALATHGPASQMEVARIMGVAPSLVVTLADHLESLDAITRLRDPGDRRRQLLGLTDDGRQLLAQCLDAASEIDDETAGRLSTADRVALHRILGMLSEELSLPR
ncbi:MAG: MarR family transcriptional regulator [Nocardia sp.]|nr:MarR family transcriptional regulator [Nocardia sp.]NUS92288.1 MarR family transcriptional regulator [Nocardia sp.]